MDESSLVKLRIYFSDFFGVSPGEIEEYGAFDISLINDLPLFIDPFLLFNSENPEYQQLHANIINYVRFLRDVSSSNPSAALIANWFRFPEIRQTWLGYSSVGNAGHGLGVDFANALQRNLRGMFANFGDETVTRGSHLEKLCLVKNGVGRDNISDFTTNLIHAFLASYTEKFAKAKLRRSLVGRFAVPRAEFNFVTKTWKSKTYELPRFGNDYVLITPVDILTKDEAWINQNDFVENFTHIAASLPNAELRAQVDRYLIEQIPYDAKRQERRAGILKAAEEFPEVIDHFIRDREERGEEAEAVSSEKVREARSLFHDQLRKLVGNLHADTAFYQEAGNSHAEATRRVRFLKQVIEDQDGYRYFYVDGRRVRREQDLQIMFKLVWYASRFDVNSEVNSGRGPADFAISEGSRDKSIVEFKLGSNKKLRYNLQKQAEIYSKSGRATQPPIKVILCFSDTEIDKVMSILNDLGMDKDPNVTIIDASPKPSASIAR